MRAHNLIAVWSVNRPPTRCVAPSKTHSSLNKARRHKPRPSLLEQDSLRSAVGPLGLGWSVADGGQAHAAVLAQAADHVEDHAGLTGLVEVEAVAGDDVEQVVVAEAA